MKSSPVFGTPRLLAAIALVGVVATAAMLSSDAAGSQSLRAIDLPGDVNKCINLAEVFGHSSGAAAILLSILIVAKERRQAVWGAILITATAGLTANISKMAVVRIRPHSEGLLQVVTPDRTDLRHADVADPGIESVAPSFWDSRQRSFPSGHAATAWGLAIGLSMVFPRGVWLFGFFALLASLQRVFSGAHFPSDVLAGTAIAFSIAAILLAIPRIRGMFRADVPQMGFLDTSGRGE